jgi:hypothetical protein
VSRQCISKKSLLESAKNYLAVKLLSKEKEVPNEPVVDYKLNRQKGSTFIFLNLVIKIELHVTSIFHMVIGWERMVLQILFLGPSNLPEPTANFAQMSQKLIVSPIVKTLVFR